MEDDGTELMLDKETVTDGECLVPTFPSVSAVLKPGKRDMFGYRHSNQQVTFLPIRMTQSDTSSDITVTLENESAWNRFHSLGTEMILTKQGRRMFPCCRFRLSRLDQQKKYFLVMDIIPLDDFTYRWDGKSWEPVAVDESHSLGQICVHPESPAVGQQWMDSPVSFYKVKLTNHPTDQEGCVILRPMRRYLPRLHIVPVNPELERTIILDSPNVKIFSFPQTEFYAVTSYQNPQITHLKIDCNPFAMAFREDNQNVCLLQDKLQPCSSVGTRFQSPLLSLAQKISERRKKGAIRSKASTCFQGNRTRVVHPVTDSSKEGEGIFIKIRNAIIKNTNTDYINDGGGSKAMVSKCSAEPVLGEHMAPLEFDPTENVSSEESMPDAVEPVPPFNSTENSTSLEAFEDVISSEKACMYSTLPTKSSTSPTVYPSKPPFDKAQEQELSHLIRERPYRKGRKAKAKWWSNVKNRKPAPAAVPQKVPLQPDLEDVEGMLFVSFMAKESLHMNAKNIKKSKMLLPPPSLTHEQSDNYKDVNLSVVEQIAKLEKTLLLHLKQQKHRQVIHPCLQDVGMKLSLLDPHLPIDLQYLGVNLPLASPILECLDKINPMSWPSSPDAAGIFVSRTGKTNDLTKIKGWKEKFKTSAVQSAHEGLRNNSAFCSDMLDAYLENEAQQISDRVAVFSTCSSSPVSYQLPSKSSSYVVTLDSLLRTRSKKTYSKPMDEMPTSAQSFSANRDTLSTLQATRFVSKPIRKKQLDKSNLHLNSTGKTTSHINSVPANTRIKKLLHQMEEKAIFCGKNRTHITAARAKLALTALIDFTKKNKRPKFQMQPENKKCSEAFCHLGCVCESLDRDIRGPTHCRRVECMFECSCFKHKVLLLRPQEKTQTIQQGGQRSVLAFPIADPEKEPRPPPAPNVNNLWKTGEHDPEPIFVPVSPTASKNVSNPRSARSDLSKKVPYEEKDPVYLYFESMMTCARVREYNSNPPPQIHMFPIKKDMKELEHVNEIGEAGELLFSQKIPETNSAEMPINPNECLPTKLLEILSECNWEPHRNLVLSTLFRRMNSELLSQPFCLAMYKIQLVSTTTTKGVGRSSTVTYKVCISRADKKDMTDNLQTSVKKKQRLKDFESKVSKTCETQAEKADTNSGSKSSILIENQQKKPLPMSVLRSLSFVPGYFKANIKKAGTPAHGLIKVNGKSYSRAKLQLGRLGALNPVNRIAAFLTGRLVHRLQEQTKIVGNVSKGYLSKGGPNPGSITGNVANLLNLPLARPPLASVLQPNTTSLNAPLNTGGPPPGRTPVVPDGTRFVIMPVTPSNSTAAPSAESVTGSTLPPGQQVVLQPVTGMPGSTFVCQYNGQMIQLKPISSGPPHQPPSFINKGSTTQTSYNTGLPNNTRSLQMPLTSTPLPKMLSKPFTDITPKMHSLSGTSSINIASGMSAIKFLQSSLPGNTGTFSFRICPPTTEKKSLVSEHAVKHPKLADSSSVVLPGGFTLIKLLNTAVPPVVQANVSSDASHPAKISQDYVSTVKPFKQSWPTSQEPNCQVNEIISNPVETSNYDSSQKSIDGSNQRRDGAPFEVDIKDEPVEHSVSGNSVTLNKTDWIPKDAVMVHKSDVSESESKDFDDWPPKGAGQILWTDSADEEENLNLANDNSNTNDNVGSTTTTAVDVNSNDECFYEGHPNCDEEAPHVLDLPPDKDVRTKSSSLLNTNQDGVSELFKKTFNINAEDICKEELAFLDDCNKPSQISFGSSGVNKQVMIQEKKSSVFGQADSYDKITDVAANEPGIKNQGLLVENRTSESSEKGNYNNQTRENISLDHISISQKKLDSAYNENSASESLLDDQTYVNSTYTTSYLQNTAFSDQRNGLNNVSPLLYNMTKSSPELPDRLGNLSENCTESSEIVNQNCGANNIVMNFSEDKTPGTEFDKAENKSGDDADLNYSDEEISSNDFTSDSETTDDSGNTSNEDIDVESLENNGGKMLINLSNVQDRHQHKTKGAAGIKQKDPTSLNKSGYQPTDDLEKRLSHTEKERARRDEMRLSFGALKKALNVEEQAKMFNHDILNQARLTIWALKDRSQYLEKRKKALQQTQLVYLSKLAELSKMPEAEGKAGCDLQKQVDFQNTLQTSLTNPPVNTRWLDGEGNQLPLRLGRCKAPNYMRRISKKALRQPSITNTEKHSLPDIELQSFRKTNAVKPDTEVKTLQSNSTEVSNTLDLLVTDNSEQQKLNKSHAAKESNHVEKTLKMSKPSNKESLIPFLAVNDEVKTSTSSGLAVVQEKVIRKKRKSDVVIEEALSNPNLLGPRQLRSRPPSVTEVAKRGGKPNKKKRII